MRIQEKTLPNSLVSLNEILYEIANKESTFGLRLELKKFFMTLYVYK